MDRPSCAIRFARPADARVAGFLAERIDRCARGLLVGKSEDELLRGFERRPGSHPWIGEHVGKWLHAAALVVANQGDPILAGKTRRVVRRLLATQERDGYLGTYVTAERWTGWDVWVHKYALTGLIAWFETSGDEAALDAASSIADLLRRTFSGKRARQLVTERVSTHRGMAAGSVLGPLVDLHALAGRPADLELARDVHRALESESGPRIVATLLETGSVARVANAKAYEMLSCLHGYLRLGAHAPDLDEAIVAASAIAFRDVCEHQMHPTGSLSYDEHWVAGRPLVGRVSETCVVVTWLQFLEALYAARPAFEIVHVLQRTLLNALLGAQRPDGSAFCYFTPLAGSKPHDASLHCCGSSGPRALALAHRWLATLEDDVLTCWTLAPGRVAFEDGAVQLELSGSSQSDFLFGHPCTLRARNATSRSLLLRVRRPPAVEGPLVLTGARATKDGSAWTVDLPPGASWNGTLQWKLAEHHAPCGDLAPDAHFRLLGPWVLAADETLATVGEPRAVPGRLAWDQPAFASPLQAGGATCGFATAGASGGRFTTAFLPAADVPIAVASCSAPARQERPLDGGDVDVSWIAGTDETGEAWFALEWDHPVQLAGCVYRHGWDPERTAGFRSPPVVELRAPGSATWSEAGTLEGYETEVRLGPPPHPLPQTASTWRTPPVLVDGLRVRGLAREHGVHCAGLRPIAPAAPRSSD